MTWIIGLITKWKSTLLGLLGVITVAAIGALAFSLVIISGKNDVIELQASTNKQWSETFAAVKLKAEKDQKAVLELQATLDLLAVGAAADTERLKQLEATNAEVKELLGTRLPADLRKLLNGK